VPIAGWGLVWGIVATALPLLALVDNRELSRGASAALRLTALAGVGSVAGLATASAIAGALCIGCIGTYILVTAWAAVVWMRTREHAFAEAPRGIMLAGGIALVGFLIVLVPGMRTPHAEQKLDLASTTTKPTDAPSKPVVPAPATPAATTDMFDGPATGDAARDDLLARFVESLDPQAKQMISDLLRDYREAVAGPTPTTRALAMGDAAAKLKIVEWTDPLCPHCAMLHETMNEIEKTVPPGIFSVESRYFPLDGFCNAGVQRKSEDGVRCIGAKAQICLEANPKAHEASGALFAARAQTVDEVYKALAPFQDRKKLEACVNSADTAKKLSDDIAAAMAHNIEGTPLVLFNGKQAPGFGPLVYALVLTGGADRHPAFKSLPPPRPKPAPGADAHAGHGH
jgi:serine/threonine-protein kinase